MVSFLRTCYYGVFWADNTASRSHGLPPAAYGRHSPMSDAMQAVLANPYYLVEEVVPWLSLGRFDLLGDLRLWKDVEVPVHPCSFSRDVHAVPVHFVEPVSILPILQDGPLSSMTVPWSLKGTLLHHLCVGLCIAPSMHRHLHLSERCETALCGFLLLDMFDALARDKCKDMGLPAGSCFMAPQTRSSLQHVALSIVIVCITKDACFQPWKGNGRMTELSIEQHFGFLRCQMQNAQMSTRQFFVADARQAVKTSKMLDHQKAVPKDKAEPKLTTEELLESVHSGIFRYIKGY